MGRTRTHTVSNQAGFTIVELMIATVVFSIILLLCAMGIVQVGRQFYKGVTINRIQNTARTIADDVGQSIQFGAGEEPYLRSRTTVDAKVYCVGSVRYTYLTDASLGTETGQSPHILWKDRIPGDAQCWPVDLTQPEPNNSDWPGSGGQEMLGEDMRLPAFTITHSAGTIYNIDLTATYGKDDDLFLSNNPVDPYNPAGPRDYAKCIGQKLGGQFCASSSINTNAAKRLL